MNRRQSKQMVRPLILAASLLLFLAACGQPSATDPIDQGNPVNVDHPQWKSPPEMQIDVNKSYHAKVATSEGTFTIELFAKETPVTVNNFVFLSKEGFYDDVTFHRIMKTFMIQTGDPTGTGAGNPGYRFDNERTSLKHEPGTVAMANSGLNTNGSQFFIGTGEDIRNLNDYPPDKYHYTIFGKVVEGMDVVQKIADTPVTWSSGSRPELSVPTEKVTITSVEIIEK